MPTRCAQPMKRLTRRSRLHVHVPPAPSRAQAGQAAARVEALRQAPQAPHEHRAQVAALRPGGWSCWLMLASGLDDDSGTSMLAAAYGLWHLLDRHRIEDGSDRASRTAVSARRAACLATRSSVCTHPHEVSGGSQPGRFAGEMRRAARGD